MPPHSARGPPRRRALHVAPAVLPGRFRFHTSMRETSMNVDQSALDQAVAKATGESVATVRRIGFVPLARASRALRRLTGSLRRRGVIRGRTA